jgi:hypothetical protein
MGKVAFVSKSKLSTLFRALGFELKSSEEVQDLGNYDVIFTEDVNLKELRKSYPYKIIVPLVDLEKRRFIINERIRRFIRSTVGQAPLEE